MKTYTKEEVEDFLVASLVMEGADRDNKSLDPNYIYKFWEHYDDSSSLFSLVREVLATREEDETVFDCVNRYRTTQEETRRREDEEFQ